MSNLTNFEKELLKGANPDLLEYLEQAFLSSTKSSENVFHLISQEHYDAAGQLVSGASHGMANFLDKLERMKKVAAGQEEEVKPVSHIEVANRNVEGEGITPVDHPHEEPAPVATPEKEPPTEPAPVTNEGGELV